MTAVSPDESQVVTGCCCLYPTHLGSMDVPPQAPCTCSCTGSALRHRVARVSVDPKRMVADGYDAIFDRYECWEEEQGDGAPVAPGSTRCSRSSRRAGRLSTSDAVRVQRRPPTWRASLTRSLRSTSRRAASRWPANACPGWCSWQIGRASCRERV